MPSIPTQFFPPTPTFTHKNLPSQKGQIFIVTGGYSGAGYELSLILYQVGAKVYIAGRSKEKGLAAIEKIQSAAKASATNGELDFLKVDLADLSSIKSSVAEFQNKESRLDVLWNNAGVSFYPKGLKTAQGHDLMLGTNCLGPHLFTQLLLPSLRAAAKNSPPGHVRIVWTSSFVVDAMSPKDGLILSELDSPPKDQQRNYTNSKTGNWFLASEYGKLLKSDGILSVAQNPGNFKSDLTRHARYMEYMAFFLLHKPIMAAYTELYAGLSPDLTMEDSGGYIIPWGRKHPNPRQDLLDALKSEQDGGTGTAKRFWDWCEQQTAQYK